MRDLKPAIALIKEFEGCRLNSYQDPVGIWTIGYGATAGVHRDMHITQAQAEDLLLDDLDHRVSYLNKIILVPVTDNQLGACLSLAFNIGMSGFFHSKVLHAINQKLPAAIVAKDFLYYVHAGGHELPGLVRRRKAEAALYLTV